MKYTLIIPLFCFLIYSCETPESSQATSFSGKTMGTTYHITALEGDIKQGEVDSLLIALNQAVSTYIDSSMISMFNQTDSVFVITDPDLATYFMANCQLSDEVFKKTEGLFDPTVMPLVNLWGFGYNKGSEDLPTQEVVDSILQFVGWQKISYTYQENGLLLTKTDPRTQIDFSAVAKGYGVDLVSDLLVEKGCQNFMVEIGGEVFCKGQPEKDRKWSIGVSKPKEGGRPGDFELVIPINNQGMATSGNYRNYRIIDGQKIAHSIHPKTGQPERNTVLSATIITKSCGMADALATSCMIMGFEKSVELIQRTPDIEGLLITGGENDEFQTWKSDHFPIIE